MIDSFSYMVDRSVGRRKDDYVARMLKGLLQATGYVFMAVYRGGAAFTQGRGDVTYAQLLAEVPDGTELVIPVSMGNDFYYKGEFDMTVQQAVRDFCCQLHVKAKHSLVVCGASAATWRYPNARGHGYDRSVAQCHAVFAECGVPSVTGADELVGLTLVDAIGHIDLECEAKVFAAYKVWLVEALAWVQASTSSPAATTAAASAPGPSWASFSAFSDAWPWCSSANI